MGHRPKRVQESVTGSETVGVEMGCRGLRHVSRPVDVLEKAPVRVVPYLRVHVHKRGLRSQDGHVDPAHRPRRMPPRFCVGTRGRGRTSPTSEGPEWTGSGVGVGRRPPRRVRSGYGTFYARCRDDLLKRRPESLSLTAYSVAWTRRVRTSTHLSV